MLEFVLRFVAGGIAVSAFAVFGDALRPKSFAGLFGAAPSIALATLAITLSKEGAGFATVEGRPMIIGAFARAGYSWVACLLLKKFMVSSWVATWRPSSFGSRSPSALLFFLAPSRSFGSIRPPLVIPAGTNTLSGLRWAVRP
jgi:hypothetical protein